MTQLDRPLAAAAVLQVGTSLVHGWAHATIPVEVLDWQLGVAAVVLFGAPVTGIALVATGHRRTGLWTLLCAGLIGFAFEGAFHFVVENPDHVATVDAGVALFGSTAAASTAAGAALALVAVRRLRRQAQGSSSNSSIRAIR